MRKALLLAVGASLLMAFVLGTLLLKSEKALPEPAARNSANLVRMHSPTLGNADASVVIVEFLDPACETCKAFYPVVKKMIADNPGRIRLVLRYAPFHKGSDKVVAMLEGARKPGKFWPALEALLATQADWAPHHAAEVAQQHAASGGGVADASAVSATAANAAAASAASPSSPSS